MTCRKINILTFDIEEWFHILDNPLTKYEKNWNSLESRIYEGMDVIFDILKQSNMSATFFVVGWVAEKYPEIIKKISNKGFEIASHTHMHQLVYEQDKKTFFRDVERSIKTLEDISGQKVISFRAPGFSITENNLWAFEALYNLGIKNDCSLFPARRSHGGFSSHISSEPFIIEYNNIKLREFPINTFNMFGFPIVFSGGGYFRLIPYNFIKYFSNNSDYIMTYFHPRDFDTGQPMIPGLSSIRRFKSYVGIKKCKSKLNKWLTEFNFIDLKKAVEIIDWNNVNEIKF